MISFPLSTLHGWGKHCGLQVLLRECKKTNSQVDDHSFHQLPVRLSKVRVLRKHQCELQEEFDDAQEKSNTPLSEVDPDSIHMFVDSKKKFLATVEGDLRDGKRRVTATKGPRRRSAEPDDDAPSGSADESGSDDDQGDD